MRYVMLVIGVLALIVGASVAAPTQSPMPTYHALTATLTQNEPIRTNYNTILPAYVVDYAISTITNAYVSRTDGYAISSSTPEPNIRELGRTGRICEVYGHRWTQDYTSAVYEPDVMHRRCDICGKQETMNLGWK
jgi:hypothetical protein